MAKRVEAAEAVKRYRRWLVSVPLAERSKREYLRNVEGFCDWLAGARDGGWGGDPLSDPLARDYAARDFKRFLKVERGQPASSVSLVAVNAQLAIAPGETVPVPVIDGVLIGRMEIGTWQTQAGGLDVLRGIPKSTTAMADFHELSARAVTAQVSGRPILIADLDDVVRSKRIAGRPKDREALPELEKLRSAADDASAG